MRCRFHYLLRGYACYGSCIGTVSPRRRAVLFSLYSLICLTFQLCMRALRNCRRYVYSSCHWPLRWPVTSARKTGPLRLTQCRKVVQLWLVYDAYTGTQCSKMVHHTGAEENAAIAPAHIVRTCSHRTLHTAPVESTAPT